MPAKGAETRQRIVERAAPVFNQRGFVGASMRDLVEATGRGLDDSQPTGVGDRRRELGPGDESHRRLDDRVLDAQHLCNSSVHACHAIQMTVNDAPVIIEAALNGVTNRARNPVERLQRMIRSFAKSARKPVIAGGCPIMNTAIEADDTHPELRDRARHSMTLWHRLIGRIVKDGVTDGLLAPNTDPYGLASLITASLEGGLMLARLYDDAAHAERVVEHLVAHVETLRAPAEPTR